jgi:hypothetical protein
VSDALVQVGRETVKTPQNGVGDLEILQKRDTVDQNDQTEFGLFQTSVGVACHPENQESSTQLSYHPILIDPKVQEMAINALDRKLAEIEFEKVVQSIEIQGEAKSMVCVEIQTQNQEFSETSTLTDFQKVLEQQT